MDPVTLGVVFTALTGAISSLFWLYVRELQRQIGSITEERDRLRLEKDDLADTIRKNNESITKISDSQQTLVNMVQQIVMPAVKGGPE